jgi:hypothetical protein
VDRRDQRVRIAGDHGAVPRIAELLPEAGDCEERLVGHIEPHLPFQRRLAAVEVMLSWVYSQNFVTGMRQRFLAFAVCLLPFIEFADVGAEPFCLLVPEHTPTSSYR